jgi:high affinity Mn2+ porin
MAALLLAAAPMARCADSDALEQNFAVHGQFTYVEQDTTGFRAPYAGPNSLSPHKGAETTDATLYLGANVRGVELWANAELDQGFGLDNTLGAAGFPSGEAYKVGKNAPYLRLPRLFVRKTINGGGELETVAPAANQLGGSRTPDRWVITAGKFGVGDVFDVNQYAHDPRTDFLNWAAIDAGTFDYAADAWGYTVGLSVEWYQGSWTLRAGGFDLSDVPNSPHLEPAFHEFQLILETEKRYLLKDRPGKLLLTLFDSRGRMGSLDAAVDLADRTGSPVDIAAVREFRSRFGAHFNLEQQLTPTLGLFARLGKAGGNVEAYEFTDIDQTLSTGLSLKGNTWGRSQDTVGIAGIVNQISAARERYLNAGGLGILVGDGKLPHPGPENILETYYQLALLSFAQLTVDYQLINHPAYNRERGPVSVFAVRIHAQL